MSVSRASGNRHVALGSPWSMLYCIKHWKISTSRWISCSSSRMTTSGASAHTLVGQEAESQGAESGDGRSDFKIGPNHLLPLLC